MPTDTHVPVHYYTGVGSRETPPHVIAWMIALGQYLAEAGYGLRSGGAPGADEAFETGARKVTDAHLEIYLPWKGFNGNPSKLFGVSEAAMQLASSIHPAWGSLKTTKGNAGQKLHARNCYQVLGKTLSSPSKFLISYTEDGCETEASRTRLTGGTATAIVLAERKGIPVFNLGKAESVRRLMHYLKGLGVSYPASMAASPIAGQASLFN